MASFAHLHVHTEYSLLDGLSKIPDLVAAVKASGQTACALTDHGVMYGAIHFYNACKNAGIKAIIGVEAYMSETSHLSKQTRMGADQYHLTLLAKNIDGYRNLMKLVSVANLEGFSYKPRIDFELLEKYHEGIICLSGCSSGILAKKLEHRQEEEATMWAKKFLALFGDRYFIEIQSHPGLEQVELIRPKLIKLAQSLGIPLVATNDVHYIKKEDAEAQDALLAVQTRKTIDDTNRLSMLDCPDFYLKSTERMVEEFKDYPESIENTQKIADQCNVEIPTGKMIFPEYPLKSGQTPESALRELVYQKLPRRFEKPSQVVKDRLDYELNIICDKGYASYFLIVQDFINWAKSVGIRVGPGRGSAAGALVSYVLRITSIDPLFHNLPFERFMNPQRPSPPDIDVDIADVRRDEVIRYVAKKYGEDHVAQIITFGAMEARAAIRDIGRVLGMPYAEPDRIAKLIPPKTLIRDAILQVPEISQAYKESNYKKLLDLAQKVEGNVRHASVHAAGVVVADKPLTYYTAIQRESKGGKIVTQYDMYALDLNVADNAIGLLKIDFLGLRNLSILGAAIDFIKAQSGTIVDISDIPLDEPLVYDMLSKGETTGVFQLESGGMRRVARSLKPSRFSDITAMVALYRPGPMDLIDDFIAGKKDGNKIKYPHPSLKTVLEETYGIPVYQEQILQIANIVAGYSLGEADILRRAIGKKKRSILDKERARFVKGAADRGYSKEKALEIWGFIDKFAGYGFNKSHSASYAMIAYQTAYMKALYPIEYMAALLSIESSSNSAIRDERIAQGIDEAKRMGIAVLPPHINTSLSGFSIEPYKKSLHNKAIRFGFSAIKNVGEAAVEHILEIRAKEKKFVSFTHFCSVIESRKVNKKVIESLIWSGTFDAYGNRNTLVESLEAIRTKSATKQVSDDATQESLFDTKTEITHLLPQDTFSPLPEIALPEKLEKEKALLGVYLSEHPQQSALALIKEQIPTALTDIDFSHKQSLRVGGILTRIHPVVTKKTGQLMAFATLDDGTAKIDLVLFPKTYEKYQSQIKNDAAIIVSGDADGKGDKPTIIVNSLAVITPFDTQNQLFNDKSGAVTIEIPRGTTKDKLQEIGSLLKSKPGDTPITIIIPNGDQSSKTFKLPYTVNYTKELEQQIQAKLQAK
jgi:DNA polymerase-3 subunit alpha